VTWSIFTDKTLINCLISKSLMELNSSRELLAARLVSNSALLIDPEC
jgi:hypothetical protein